MVNYQPVKGKNNDELSTCQWGKNNDEVSTCQGGKNNGEVSNCQGVKIMVKYQPVKG